MLVSSCWCVVRMKELKGQGEGETVMERAWDERLQIYRKYLFFISISSYNLQALMKGKR
jgi:hypothetical protein